MRPPSSTPPSTAASTCAASTPGSFNEARSAPATASRRSELQEPENPEPQNPEPLNENAERRTPNAERRTLLGLMLRDVRLRLLANDVNQVAHGEIDVNQVQPPVGQHVGADGDVAGDVVGARVVGVAVHRHLEIA